MTDIVFSSNDDALNENEIPVLSSGGSGTAAGQPHQNGHDTPSPITPYLEAFFKNATKSFEKMIRTAIDSVINRLNNLEANLGASLEFERNQKNYLELKQNQLEKKVHAMEGEISELKSIVMKQEMAANKNERFSRRNNFRLHSAFSCRLLLLYRLFPLRTVHQ